MDSEKMFHQRSSIPLLVVDKNKDHQLLIGYCLRTKIPQVEPTFATTTKETLSFLKRSFNFLKRSFNQRENFPKLILLDLSLPKTSHGFALLEEIRILYPLLPVIILSSEQDQPLVNKAYQLGAHSFLGKPSILEEWENHFQMIKEYWLWTVTLS
ncbi:response regulator [Spirosoma humi]